MLRRNGPVVKSVESVLRLEGSLWGERFVEEVYSRPIAWEILIYTDALKIVAAKITKIGVGEYVVKLQNANVQKAYTSAKPEKFPHSE